ncbi:glycosyl hydrolase [Streptomyces albidoflavus]
MGCPPPGANGGASLFQINHDHLSTQGLDNVIWVWSVQDNPEDGWSRHHPGDAYVEVVSLDVWYKNHPSQATTGNFSPSPAKTPRPA